MNFLWVYPEHCQPSPTCLGRGRGQVWPAGLFLSLSWLQQLSTHRQRRSSGGRPGHRCRGEADSLHTGARGMSTGVSNILILATYSVHFLLWFWSQSHVQNEPWYIQKNYVYIALYPQSRNTPANVRSMTSRDMRDMAGYSTSEQQIQYNTIFI